jgi:hypothetical protein
MEPVVFFPKRRLCVNRQKSAVLIHTAAEALKYGRTACTANDVVAESSMRLNPEQWRTQDFFRGGLRQGFFTGGSTNSVEDRGKREWGSRGVSPLLRGSTQFPNE